MAEFQHFESSDSVFSTSLVGMTNKEGTRAEEMHGGFCSTQLIHLFLFNISLLLHLLPCPMSLCSSPGSGSQVLVAADFADFSSPVYLGMRQVHSVLYEGAVGALRLHALFDRCYDSRETPVQGCEVWFGQDGVDGVEGQSLAHG